MLIKRAVVVFTLMNDKLFSHFNFFECFLAVGTLKRDCFLIILSFNKGKITNFTEVLSFTPVIIVDIDMRSLTAGTGDIMGYFVFRISSFNGFKFFTVFSFIFSEKLVMIQFFEDLDDGQFIDLEIPIFFTDWCIDL